MNILFIDDKELLKKLYYDFTNYFSLYKQNFIIKIIHNNFNDIQLDNINIAFIDVDLKNHSGIEIAKKITSMSPSSKIIYFSYREDLIFDVLDTNIFQFIRKAKYSQDTIVTFNKLEKYIKENKKIINYNGRKIIVDINDIQYIVSIGKNIIIHCRNNDYILKSSIKEILETFNSFELIQIQRSLIINVNIIKKATKSNNSYIIGRKYQDNLDKQYKKYLINYK